MLQFPFWQRVAFAYIFTYIKVPIRFLPYISVLIRVPLTAGSPTEPPYIKVPIRGPLTLGSLSETSVISESPLKQGLFNSLTVPIRVLPYISHPTRVLLFIIIPICIPPYTRVPIKTPYASWSPSESSLTSGSASRPQAAFEDLNAQSAYIEDTPPVPGQGHPVPRAKMSNCAPPSLRVRFWVPQSLQ